MDAQNRYDSVYVIVGTTHPNFNHVEFDTFRSEAGHNYFTMTPKKWIDGVNAIGIISKAGKYNGGTYAHKDIALQFASWISPEINLYIIKEFQRLKADEQKQLGWTVKRELAKINYRIHTDAIKDNIIIPLEITKEQASFVYASEADVLNVALFGITAREWRDKNPDKKGIFAIMPKCRNLYVSPILKILTLILSNAE